MNHLKIFNLEDGKYKMLQAGVFLSSFSVLIVPGLNISLGLLSYLFIMFAISRPKEYLTYIAMAYLTLAFFVDLLWIVILKSEINTSYSINILRMVLYVLIAEFIKNRPFNDRLNLCIAIGLSAILSEIFVVLNPEFRDAYYLNATSIFEVTDYWSIFRPTGLIGDPNYFAMPLIVMTVALLQLGRVKSFYICTILVFFTGSRSALIAIAISAILISSNKIQNFGKSKWRNIIGISVIILIGLLIIFNVRNGDTSDSNTERLILLEQGLEGIFSAAFLNNTYGSSFSLGLDSTMLMVHNYYIQTLGTSLLLGLFITYKSIMGMMNFKSRPIAVAIIVEMMFLDFSSSNWMLLIFFLFCAKVDEKKYLHNS